MGHHKKECKDSSGRNFKKPDLQGVDSIISPNLSQRYQPIVHSVQVSPNGPKLRWKQFIQSCTNTFTSIKNGSQANMARKQPFQINENRQKRMKREVKNRDKVRVVGDSSGNKRGIACPVKLTENPTPKNKGRGEKLCNDQRQRERTSTAFYSSVLCSSDFLLSAS